MLDFILGLDKGLFVLVNSHWTSAWADLFFPFITDLHKTLFFKLGVVPVLLAIFIWRKGLKKGIIVFTFCALSVATTDLVGNWAFKKTVQRPRPPETIGLEVTVRSPSGGFSFISNHAANTFNLASFTSSLFPPAAIPLYSFATLIAYSRVYNGVHFPTDVIAGGILGFLFGLAYSHLCKRVLMRIETTEAIKS